MFKSALVALALLIGCLGFVHTSLANGGGPLARIRLEARMRAGVTEAKVSYREESRGGGVRRTVQAEISRTAPNTTFAVWHNGVQIATLRTNDLGLGRVEISGPAVPPMMQGDRVAVGAMGGTLVRR